MRDSNHGRPMDVFHFLIFFYHTVLSHRAYGTSAIFKTISVAPMYTLALVLSRAILLAIPTPPKRHSFCFLLFIYFFPFLLFF